MQGHRQNPLVRKFHITIFFLGIMTAFPSIAHAVRSAENRGNKALSATLGVYGLSAAVFASDNFLIEGSYNYQEVDSVWVNTYKTRLRSFFGNSFYGSLGADYERRKAPPVESGGDGVNADEFFLATGALGNQWQWTSFTMGIDWVQFRVPVGKVVSAHLAEPIKGRATPTALGGLDIKVFGLYAGISI